MSYESTRAAMDALAALYAADPIEKTIADTKALGAEAQAKIDARLAELGRAGWLKTLDDVAEKLPLLGPILTLLGVPHADKAAAIAHILADILEQTR